MLLAIDTATSFASIALFDDRVLAELTWQAAQEHSRQLLPEVQHLLRLVGRTTQDISAVAVTLGPGSFNGLRVGIASAKAICLALAIPVIGVDTLELTAFPFRYVDRPIRPLYDAGRGDVATGLYRGHACSLDVIEEPRIIPLDEAIEASPRGTFFCGEIRSEWRERIGSRNSELDLTVPAAEPPRHASTLAELGARGLRDGRDGNVATLQPIYLRRPPVAGAARAIGSVTT